MSIDRDERPAPGAVLDTDELAQLATEVLAATPFPALVLRAPSATVVAASPHAIRLLNPAGGRVLGRSLAEFVLDWPDGLPELFTRANLNGLEMRHALRRSSGDDQPIRMWIRHFDSQPSSRFVLAVLVPDDATELALTATEWSDAPTVVGTADANLLLERVSSDAEALFGSPLPELIGRSLLTLLQAQDVPPFLTALGEAFHSGRGVTLDVDLATPAGTANVPERHTCEVLVVPLDPSPSCAFVFLPVPPGQDRQRPASDLAGMLLRLGQGAQLAQLARGALARTSHGLLPGIDRLTARELQIIGPLLEGDRPPAIAATLFLSKSTVRNHLSSIYAKLGVTSQQELVNAFRTASRD